MNPKGLKTHDWGVEVGLVIVHTRGLGETSHYEASLVLNECSVLEFPVEDPLRGDDVRVGRTWYCFENVQAAHILDLNVHHGAPFVRIGCIECIPNCPRIGR